MKRALSYDLFLPSGKTTFTLMIRYLFFAGLIGGILFSCGGTKEKENHFKMEDSLCNCLDEVYFTDLTSKDTFTLIKDSTFSIKIYNAIAPSAFSTHSGVYDSVLSEGNDTAKISCEIFNYKRWKFVFSSDKYQVENVTCFYETALTLSDSSIDLSDWKTWFSPKQKMVRKNDSVFHFPKQLKADQPDFYEYSQNDLSHVIDSIIKSGDIFYDDYAKELRNCIQKGQCDKIHPTTINFYVTFNLKGKNNKPSPKKMKTVIIGNPHFE
jgi:hypothetical protein